MLSRKSATVSLFMLLLTALCSLGAREAKADELTIFPGGGVRKEAESETALALFELSGSLLVRANNYPFVTVDIDDTGELLPASCVVDVSSETCSTELVTMAGHAALPIPRALSSVPTLESTRLYERVLQASKGSDMLQGKYAQTLSQARAQSLKDLQVRGYAELQDAFAQHADHYLHVSKRVVGAFAVKQLGVMSCGDFASKAYAKLLGLQQAGIQLSIHAVIIGHQTSNYNHVFLLVNADLPTDQMQVRLFELEAQLDRAIIVDPYSGPQYAYLPFNSAGTLNLHRGWGKGVTAFTIGLPSLSDLTFSPEIREALNPKVLAIYDKFLKAVLELGREPPVSPFDPELPFNKFMLKRNEIVTFAPAFVE